VGGVVVETGLDRVVEGVKAQGRVIKRPGDGGGGGMSAIGQGLTGAFGKGHGVWTGR
jgi:AP-3 complex subunit sigma